jgi:hypothetical protein
MLEEYTAEEQSSVVRFSGQKDLMQRIVINKCFLFMVGSVCRLKWFTAGLKNSSMDVQMSQMMKWRCGSD